MKKFILKLDLHDDKDKRKALKTVSALSGIDSIIMNMKERTLMVVGTVDPIDVVSKLRKFWPTYLVLVGPAKEPEKKEEPKKEDGKKDEPNKEDGKKEEKLKKKDDKTEDEKKEEPEKKEDGKEEENKAPSQPTTTIRRPYYPAYYPPINTSYNYHPNYQPHHLSIEDNPNACGIS